MKTARPGFRTAVAIAALLACGLAQAGRSCEPQALTVNALERGLGAAERTHQALEAEHARSGSQVVVLARAGQDLRKYGLRWSHLGFAWREDTPQGPAWQVVHKLNECGTAQAALYRQGLGQFFLDTPWRYDAAWVVPRADVQQALLTLLRDDARVAALHQPAYSMVSYAWSTRYQQSNQWALETLALAQSPAVHTRAQAQAWLQIQDYVPTTLHLGALTRLGGRMTAANIAFDDHPNDKRFPDRIDTVTVDSVFAWMQRSGLGGAAHVLASGLP